MWVSLAAVSYRIVPSIRDLAEAEKRKALLPVQWVDMESGRGRRKSALTSWDSSSNVSIARKKMAMEAAWKGFPVVCSLMTTGGKPEE